MNKKSFFEILGSSITTFKNSLGGILLTYCFAIPLCIGAYLTAIIVFKEPYNQLMTERHTHLTAPMVIIGILLLIFFTYGSTLLQTWQTLVIKNNIFKGVNDLGEALKKSWLKAFQILLLLILTIPLFIFICFVAANFFPPCINFLPLLQIPLLPFGIVLIGIILSEEKFSKAFANALGICLSNYFRILIFFILLVIMLLILLIGIVVLMFIFKFVLIGLTPLIFLGSLFLQLTVTPFYICFFTELFLDGQGSISKYAFEQEESYPEVIDISDVVDQMPPQPQQTYKDEPPEGLRQIGGDYNDRK